MFFLAKQHQAMLRLKGILFETFAVVFVGNFPKLTKTFFTEGLVLSEIPVCSYSTIFNFPYLGSSFVKVIQKRKHQRYHF
jgi:hypothetical protein